jgi:hypothetical protein
MENSICRAEEDKNRENGYYFGSSAREDREMYLLNCQRLLSLFAVGVGGGTSGKNPPCQ